MTAHAITIEIDDAKLASYTGEFPAVCWHARPAQPGSYDDALAAERGQGIRADALTGTGLPPVQRTRTVR